MTLGQKLRMLRGLEGECRGLSGPLTKAEMVKLIRSETGKAISTAYLSQLESGARTHMTNTTRLVLARFFRVHPGFLVDDPDEFREHLATPLGGRRQALTTWLRVGAARFRHDPLVAETLDRLAAYPDRHEALQLFGELLRRPPLMGRLLHVMAKSSRMPTRSESKR